MKCVLIDPLVGTEYDVSAWADVKNFDPNESDLGNPIDACLVSLVDDDTSDPLPVLPREGLRVKLYEDDGVRVLFFGRLSEVYNLHPDSGLEWSLRCQGWGVRALEAVVQDADFSSTTTTDRAAVIAIWTSALSGRDFGSVLAADDPIIAANAPDWAGVRSTAFFSGINFNGKTVAAAMLILMTNVPNVFWNLETDYTVKYGAPLATLDLAPAPLHTDPGAIATMERSYTEQVLADTPALWLRLGDLGTAEAMDSSGNGMDGVYSGDVLQGRAGAVASEPVSGAGLFRGGNVTVADNALLKPATVTVGAWMRSPAYAANGVALEKSNAGRNRGYGLFYAGGLIKWWVNDPAGASLTTAALTGARWHRVVGTYDGAHMKLYVDGALVTTVTYSTAITHGVDALMVGARSGGAAWAGFLDDVDVYSGALAAARIAAQYAAASARLTTFSRFRQDFITGDHRNMLTFTGATTTEVATDEVSYAKYGAILEALPKTNTAAAAGVTRQLAYANLYAMREKVRVQATVVRAGYRAGQLVDVCDTRLGSGTIPAPFVAFPLIFGRSDWGVLAQGGRGRFVIQVVTRTQRAAQRPADGMPSVASYDLKCGDYFRDLPTALAAIARSTGA